MAAPGVPLDGLQQGLKRRAGADVKGQVFLGLLLIALLLALAALVAVVWSALSDGWSILTTNLGTFLTHGVSTVPEDAGVWQGIKGSLLLAGIVAVSAFPVGIGAAVYLEEYATDSWLTRTIQITVRNLAGVPSIVYGLLGLAVFVKGLGGITGGSSVISGGLTLGLLVLPIVVITASEAIKAVPKPLREGAYGLGATQWEVIRTTVLPVAAPGILTGTVLSIARAVGEAAPILVVGAVNGFFQTGDQDFLEQLQGAFTALPMLIYTFTKLPANTWAGHAAATSVIILVVVLAINSVAVYARIRVDRRSRR